MVSLQGAWRGVAYQPRSCCCLHDQPRHTDRAPHVLPCAHPCACRRPEAAPPGSSGWQRPRREAIAASLTREAATRALELSGSAPRCRLTPGAVLSTMFGQGRRAEDQMPMKSAMKSSSWRGPAIARQRPASALGRLNTAYFRWLTRILAPCLFLLLQGGLTRHAGPARPVATHQGPNASQGEEKGGAPLLGERTGGRSTAGEVAPDKQRASTQRPAPPRAAPQKKAKKAPAYLTSDADLAPFGVKVWGGGLASVGPCSGVPRVASSAASKPTYHPSRAQANQLVRNSLGMTGAVLGVRAGALWVRWQGSGLEAPVDGRPVAAAGKAAHIQRAAAELKQEREELEVKWWVASGGWALQQVMKSWPAWRGGRHASS